MTLGTRLVMILVASTLVFSAGFYTAYSQFKPETTTVYVPKVEVVEKEKIVTKIVKVKETKPDGTTTTTTTEEKVEDKVETSSQELPQPVPKFVPTYRDWSLGVAFVPRLDKEAFKPTALQLGYRVAGPVWAVGEYDWRNHEARLGVRLEF